MNIKFEKVEGVSYSPVTIKTIVIALGRMLALAEGKGCFATLLFFKHVIAYTQAFGSIMEEHQLHDPEEASQPQEKSYALSRDQTAIFCCRCGRASYNPNDVRHLYCSNCGFHDRTLLKPAEKKPGRLDPPGAAA